MKKTMKLMMSLFVVLVFSSAFTGSGIAPVRGSIAPAVKLNDKNNVLAPAQHQGKYLLLNFWSAADGKSRLKANELNTAVKELNGSDGNDPKVSLVSVNFDRSEKLFREIVKRDNLDAQSQFYATGKEADKLRRAYNLHKGLSSFLIGPDGRILAVNPDKKDLTKILSR